MKTLLQVNSVISFISGGRIFHTATRLNNNDILIYGGRTSPSKPCTETLLLSLDNKDESESSHCTNGDANCSTETGHESSEGLVKTSYQCTMLDCEGDIPEPWWRHSATHIVLPDGKSLVCSLCVER